MVLKHKQLEDRESDITELRISKRQHVNAYDNKDKQSLDEYEDEGDIYFSLLFFPRQESNRLKNLDKRTQSLNHLV